MFDLDGFLGADLKRPRRAVPVPQLKPWFPNSNGTDPSLLVKGLDSRELLLVTEMRTKDSPRRRLAMSILDALPAETTAALRGLFGGNPEETPENFIACVETIRMGVIKDDGASLFDYPHVIKIAEHFPPTFTLLVNTINELSGKASEARVGES